MLDLKENFNNKKILIYGYGISGKACFHYLKKKNKVFIYDDNKKIIPSVTKKKITKEKILKSKFDIIIISPGIDKKKCGLSKFIKKNDYKTITELDIFYLNNLKNKKITITGTNGKSTTAKLIYEIIKKNNKDVRLGGNIGKPLLFEKNINKNTLFVIEASSYQIEYSKYFRSDIAAILNISPDHLERHQTFSKYINAKLKLIKNQNKNGLTFINKSNLKFLSNKKINSKIIKVKKFPQETNKIKNNYFKNLNNLNNLSFAISISKKLGLNKKKTEIAINSFKGLPYRQQIIYKRKNLQIINDSKSTSFSSTNQLLKSYKNIFWILGGLPKKGDHFTLENKYFKNIKAYIYGKNKKFFQRKLTNKIPFKNFKDIRHALFGVLKDLKKEKDKNLNIVFSPCSASFDQFENFEKRGEFFNKMLKKTNFIKKAI